MDKNEIALQITLAAINTKRLEHTMSGYSPSDENASIIYAQKLADMYAVFYNKLIETLNVD